MHPLKSVQSVKSVFYLTIFENEFTKLIMKTSINTPPTIWRNNKKIANLIGKIGTVESFTQVHAKPSSVITNTPYYIAIVNFEKLNKKMTVEIYDNNNKKISIGSQVELIYRKHQVNKDGLIAYGLKGIII